MNGNVRKLTDGAMMTAIMGVLLLINRQTAGLIESMMLFLLPLPMVFYSAKYGMKDSWPVFAAIVILSFLLGGSLPSMFYFATESLIGLVYGAGVRKHTDSRRLVLSTCLLAVVVDVLSMLVFAELFGYNLTEEVAEMTKTMETMLSTSGMAVPANMNLKQMVTEILIITPVLTGFMEGVVTHFASRLMLKRLNIKCEPATPLALYYPPKWTGYVGLAGYIGYMYTTMRPLADTKRQMLLQGLSICAVFYLWVMAFIGLLVLIKIMRPKAKGWIVIPAFLIVIICSSFSPLFGFLYVTTDLHHKAVEGVTGNA